METDTPRYSQHLPTQFLLQADITAHFTSQLSGHICQGYSELCKKNLQMTSTYRSVTCSQVNDVILSQQALNAKHFRLPHNFKPIKTSTSRPFYFSPFGASWLHPWKPSHPPSQTLIGRHSATKGSDWLRRTPIKPPPSSPDFMGKKFEQSGHVTWLPPHSCPEMMLKEVFSLSVKTWTENNEGGIFVPGRHRCPRWWRGWTAASRVIYRSRHIKLE